MKTERIRQRLHDASHQLADFLHALPDDHPLQIALRTYTLALSLALGPALLPFLTSRKARTQGLRRALHILARELSPNAFATSITVGVAGGAAIRRLWDRWTEGEVVGIGTREGGGDRYWDALHKLRTWAASLQDWQKSFVSNVVSSILAVALLHSRRRHATSAGVGRPSPTLDLSLLLLVRAMDSAVQMMFFKPSAVQLSRLTLTQKEDQQSVNRKWSTRLDALVFWACSARIMWCFFYEPDRLPRSYNKWIMTLASIDPRLLAAIRAIRAGKFSYVRGVSIPQDLVTSLSRDLGYPAAWGDPAVVPAYGLYANPVWRRLSIPGRQGVAGLPCEVVHGGVTGGSCTANAAIRGAQAFAEALAIYLPVHFLPIAITRPRKLLEIPRLLATALSAARSATFLSAFVSSTWFTICLTRTLLLARLFPHISHDFWDGPFGCAFMGSLVCGASIWIERGSRRGEMALYVLPRAIRACLAADWVKSGKFSVRLAERTIFVLSLASLLTTVVHRPDTLRGLSRWTLAFVMKGPNAGFWRRKRLDTNAPSTPAHLTRTSTPLPEGENVDGTA
ncbi:uncharacterized protein BXZ73DRAFT_96866 [Epithele typhae]|uniref:uncharacterized protein n=1 Tax=Epithele typhae TaxID=378194 RepID=UPI002007627F|nr:uncharacterized protein BXZ73DRAFT_96866 [Epithele typhae]KAH9944378.1 hypothetical protein BXZ73DRAFT_96866 [Epithele typhae]